MPSDDSSCYTGIAPQLPPLKKHLHLSYSHFGSTLAIEENDFTTFEALGILEAAKAMIAADWMKK